ncbi:response regulator transcription factor [Acinetobacter sp. ANC 3832]|uniref:response regulator transcription factor n=1 Tax=Acinetobacter sp. ANC 3832 TaxID=1977874 RepID=UPI000A358366|nr:response regulator transcription factor [Acinetobacter sp. ANC 3832]OTG92584.1 hypothetical protein B9T35_12950 [Acinetobacter sp. ANC 3832]
MPDEITLAIPVLIVEDDPLIQIRLKGILLSLGYSINQILISASIQDAKLRIALNSPHFTLLDLGLPDGNGIELISLLKQNNPQTSILIISAWSTEDTVLNALKMGATGYVLKERDDLEVTLAIRNIFRGGAPISPFIAEKILNFLDQSDSINSQDSNQMNHQHTLSAHEIKILTLVSQGFSNKEISTQFSLSKHHIDGDIKHIYQKLAQKSASSKSPHYHI